ncbi:MAG: helix-turn-helix domain-containing protein [bacterium]
MDRARQRLRQRREEVGLTIDDLARATKYRPEIIRQFEEGRTRIFPADVYLRAFIKAYAREVGLDADEVIRLLNQEIEIAPSVSSQLDGKRNGVNRWLLLAILIGIAAAVGLVVFFSRSSGRRGEANRIEEIEAAYQRRVVGSVRITETDTSESQNKRISEQGIDGSLEKPESAAIYSRKASNLSCLEIVAMDSVFLTVTSSGDTLLNGRLDRGDSREIFSDKDFVIHYLSSRDAIALKLDGKPFDIPNNFRPGVQDLVIRVGRQNKAR